MSLKVMNEGLLPVSKIGALCIAIFGLLLMYVSKYFERMPIFLAASLIIGFLLFFQIFLSSLYKTLKIKNRYLIWFEIK